MSTVEEIKEQVLALTAKEQATLRDWLLELNWENWGEQFERDGHDGRLDARAGQAIREDVAGETRPL